MVDDAGNTALHYAAETGDENVVMALLAAGAGPSVINSENMTPWQMAVANSHSEVARIVRQAATQKKAGPGSSFLSTSERAMVIQVSSWVKSGQCL